VLHALILTQYWRVTDGQTDGRTDGQTDGIAVANTALAMRALRRAVKICEHLAKLQATRSFMAVSFIQFLKMAIF